MEQPAEVARLLGKQKSLSDGNYGRELKQTLARLSDFFGAHGRNLPTEIARTLSDT